VHTSQRALQSLAGLPGWAVLFVFPGGLGLLLAVPGTRHNPTNSRSGRARDPSRIRSAPILRGTSVTKTSCNETTRPRLKRPHSGRQPPVASIAYRRPASQRGWFIVTAVVVVSRSRFFTGSTKIRTTNTARPQWRRFKHFEGHPKVRWRPVHADPQPPSTGHPADLQAQDRLATSKRLVCKQCGPDQDLEQTNHFADSSIDAWMINHRSGQLFRPKGEIETVHTVLSERDHRFAGYSATGTGYGRHA